VQRKKFEDAQEAWFKLRHQAQRGPVASDVPKLAGNGSINLAGFANAVRLHR
jgi:hypothetical protein